MKYFALIILLVLLLTALIAIFLLARWPGQIARDRDHPQADAVAVAGWCSFLLPIPLWPLAIVWAHYGSGDAKRAGASLERIGAQP